MKNWVYSFLALIFPPCCVVCGCPLSQSEECICIKCNINIPRTNYHLLSGNPVEKFFWGAIPIERATSFFFYYRGSDFKNVLYDLKYHGQKKIGTVMGRIVGAELLPSGFFDGIDLIIPIPLHARKQKKRGYNQSECLVEGLSSVAGIPFDSHSVIRKEDTDTQTRKSIFTRWENVEGVFKVLEPAKFKHKHILIVDDVLTTGSTIVSCALAFQGIEGVKFSVLTLAMAKQ